MSSFVKVSFEEVIKYVTENEKVKDSIRRLTYLIPLVVYGFAVIFLLKASQIILGWKF